MARNAANPGRRGISLELRIPLLIIALLTCLLTATLLAAYQEVYSSAVVAGRERLGRAALQVSEVVRAVTENRLTMLSQVANLDPVRAVAAGVPGSDEAPELLNVLDRVGNGPDGASPVEIWRASDREVLYAIPGAPRISRDLADFPLTGGYGPWVLSEGRIYSHTVVPIEVDGEVAAFLVQSRGLQYPGYEETLRALVGPSTEFYLTDARGNWAGFTGEIEMVGVVPPRSGPFDDIIGGVMHIAHAAPVPGTDLVAVAALPLPVVLQRANAFLSRGALVLIVLTGVGAVGASALSRRFTQPLAALSDAARSIAAGDYDSRVELDRPDEIGVLADSFNSMASQVQAANTGLLHQVEQARELAGDLEAANARLQEMIASSAREQRNAEDASRAKTDFLATISHELRTPINAIVGYTDLLLLGIPESPGPGQVDHLLRLRRNGSHLARLIDDVLDLAKIEAGQLRTNEEIATGEEALDSSVSIVGPLAAEKGIEVSRNWDPAGNTRYRGDSRRVEQILVNLLGNAVKFTPPGGRIELTCRSETDEDSAAGSGEQVVLGVSDTGIGIPASKLDLIFERFVQGETGFRRTHEGSGLGLSISRELARVMGGDITVKSTEGAGSHFELRLPAAAPISRTVASLPETTRSRVSTPMPEAGQAI